MFFIWLTFSPFTSSLVSQKGYVKGRIFFTSALPHHPHPPPSPATRWKDGVMAKVLSHESSNLALTFEFTRFYVK